MSQLNDLFEVTAPLLNGTKADYVRFHDDFANPWIKVGSKHELMTYLVHSMGKTQS